MKLTPRTPKQSLNKAFLKQRPFRDEMDVFKTNLKALLNKINEHESEEHHKAFVRDFLKDTFYKSQYEINTKGRQDLVIHVGKDTSDKVGVILETKKPINKADMISAKSPNKKALHELVLYFLRERIDDNNIDIKYLIITNIYEWFIFDASIFNQLFFENKAFLKDYKDWRDKQKITGNTNLFYNEIAKPYIETISKEIPCTYFDIRNYEAALKNDALKDDENLIELFKILSPFHLLKVPFADDSNKLDKNFYTELLHIIGLEEIKEKGKLKIQRKNIERRNEGSLIENAITIIETKDCLHKIKNLESYGVSLEERLFNVALELCLTWINRVLFLKLLEAQLIDYHKGNRDYRFLDVNTIQGFDELFTLFHQVLSKLPKDRRENIKEKYSRVPYLNSSLFEISELEDQTITIESLKDTVELPLINTTILRDIRTQQGELPPLEYLFKFLDAYDFASEGTEGIKENTRSLINASVLGKVFEKINNSKAGSIYTPGFITMYMCRQSIRLAVVQKFKDKYGWNISEFSDIKNFLTDRRSKQDILEFNALINSLHLCDPAVGSGHFLVSSLNEIIAIKCELGILADDKGERFGDIEITVENDELTIFDTKRSEFFKYQIQDGKPQSKEAHRLQKSLFHEKQTIIENCLFGVDIIPHSVKICRLRLWIELLKNAYYKESTNFIELETLPNIDINIKEGNSLISRFKLKDKFRSEKMKRWIKEYSSFVDEYKSIKSRDRKTELKALINNFHSVFSGLLEDETSKLKGQLNKKIYALAENQNILFTDRNDVEKEIATRRLRKEIAKLEDQIAEINAKYKNAFEWRFEFPEVLDEEGNFIGFDVVIANPPYVYRSYEYEGTKKYFLENYKSTEGNFDLYKFFVEKSILITKPSGNSSFIISNTFLTAKTFNKFRKFIMDNSTVIEIFDLGENVFEGITVENVLLHLKREMRENYNIKVKVQRDRNSAFEHPNNNYELDLKRIFEAENSFNIYLNTDTNSLINKIRINTIKLGEIAYCTVGINTGYIKNELTAKEQIDATYHKMLSGRDIGVNSVNWKGEWIKYDKDFVDSFGDKGRTLPPEFIFTNEKILVQRTRRGLKRKLVCYFDTEKFYNLNRLSNIVLTDESFSLKYIHALLNSSLMDYYFNAVFNEYEVKPVHCFSTLVETMHFSARL